MPIPRLRSQPLSHGGERLPCETPGQAQTSADAQCAAQDLNPACSWRHATRCRKVSCVPLLFSAGDKAMMSSAGCFPKGMSDDTKQSVNRFRATVPSQALLQID